MFERHYAPSTVNTYVSALGYSHKLTGSPDPTKVFYITQMLKGYGKRGFRLDARFPITLPILDKLIQASAHTIGSDFLRCQFKAMCALAFFAFLRIGEITNTKQKGNPPLQLHQLTQLLNQKSEVIGLRLTFTDFKHNYNQKPFSMAIYRQSGACPVQLMLDYLQVRGDDEGPIFRTQSGAPVSRNMFAAYLSETITFCGLDPSRYKGHSFRIGAASHAAERGMSDAQIRILGRWKSNAFHKYIRVSTMST